MGVCLLNEENINNHIFENHKKIILLQTYIYNTLYFKTVMEFETYLGMATLKKCF